MKLARSLARRASILASAACLVAACGKRSDTPPASWQPDRSCTSSAECRPVEGCCPAPCASLVINVRDMEKMRLRLDEECKKQKRDECPQAGACAAHAYLCVRGQCALVLEGSADWPKDASAP